MSLQTDRRANAKSSVKASLKVSSGKDLCRKLNDNLTEAIITVALLTLFTGVRTQPRSLDAMVLNTRHSVTELHRDSRGSLR